MAYAAVTMNLFGETLYAKRGGKGKVKENHLAIFYYLESATATCQKNMFILALSKMIWPLMLMQEWVLVEGGKLKTLAQHVIILTYRTVNGRRTNWSS